MLRVCVMYCMVSPSSWRCWHCVPSQMIRHSGRRPKMSDFLKPVGVILLLTALNVVVIVMITTSLIISLVQPPQSSAVIVYRPQLHSSKMVSNSITWQIYQTSFPTYYTHCRIAGRRSGLRQTSTDDDFTG